LLKSRLRSYSRSACLRVLRAGAFFDRAVMTSD
jgi:hypothetical protein